jgi:hypothetical protein
VDGFDPQVSVPFPGSSSPLVKNPANGPCRSALVLPDADQVEAVSSIHDRNELTDVLSLYTPRLNIIFKAPDY